MKKLVKAAGLPLYERHFLVIVDFIKHWNSGTFLPTTNTQIKKSLRRPGAGDDWEREKERQVWKRRKIMTDRGERESVCVRVCVRACMSMGGGLWRETTVNYTFTHHITGQLKLEQSCVNRAKTNRLNSLQERERFRPDLATQALPDRSITLLSSTQLQCHSSALWSRDTDPTFPCKHEASVQRCSAQCLENYVFLHVSDQTVGITVEQSSFV